VYEEGLARGTRRSTSPAPEISASAPGDFFVAACCPQEVIPDVNRIVTGYRDRCRVACAFGIFSLRPGGAFLFGLVNAGVILPGTTPEHGH
jgi:hypothetical protein